MHSLDVTPVLQRWRGDGCAVAVRPPRQIERAWRLDPGAFEPVAVGSRIDESVPVRFEVLPERLAARFSTRTLFAELSGGERDFVAAAFHATPGTARVGGRLVSEWKPFFHGCRSDLAC